MPSWINVWESDRMLYTSLIYRCLADSDNAKELKGLQLI